MNFQKYFILFLLFLVSPSLFIPSDVRAADCRSLFNEKSEDKPINIIFLALGYTDLPDLEQLISTAVEKAFATIEPLKSNQHLFGFWIVDYDALPDRSDINTVRDDLLDSCRVEYDLTNVYEVMYVNRLPTSGGPSAIASIGSGATIALFESRRGDYTQIVSDQQTYLFLHELVGHGIASLIDEYTSISSMEEQKAQDVSSGKNCFVGTYQECLATAPWKDLIGQGCGDPKTIDCTDEPNAYQEVGCYEGCRLLPNGAFRPHDASIMNEQRKDFFGLVHQREICERIQEQTGQATGYCYDQFGIGVAASFTSRTALPPSSAPISRPSSSSVPVIPAIAAGLFVLGGVGLYLRKRLTSKTPTR